MEFWHGLVGAYSCALVARMAKADNDRPPKDFVDHTVADAVLSRADLNSARVQVRSDMSRMMRHFEVHPDRIAPQLCRRSARCRADLRELPLCRALPALVSAAADRR